MFQSGHTVAVFPLVSYDLWPNGSLDNHYSLAPLAPRRPGAKLRDYNEDGAATTRTDVRVFSISAFLMEGGGKKAGRASSHRPLSLAPLSPPLPPPPPLHC